MTDNGRHPPEARGAEGVGRAAWERDKHRVGRLVHEAWMREKQRQGFADHPFDYEHSEIVGGGVRDAVVLCSRCGLESRLHHPDMIDYDDLTPENQAYDWASGEVAYFAGYEAGRAVERGRWVEAFRRFSDLLDGNRILLPDSVYPSFAALEALAQEQGA